MFSFLKESGSLLSVYEGERSFIACLESFLLLEDEFSYFESVVFIVLRGVGGYLGFRLVFIFCVNWFGV